MQKPAGQPRAVKRRRRPVIEITPDVEEAEKPLHERIVGEIKTGGPSYLGSLGFHFLLLFALWLFVAPKAFLFEGGQGGVEIEMSLTDRLEKAAGEPKPIKIERQPIKVNPEKTVPDPKPEKKPSVEKKPGKAAGKGPLAQPVKPVNVKSLFETREPDNRKRIFDELDPEERVRQSIGRGLAWLKRQQKSAGNWRLHEGYPDPGYFALRTDTGATALALLAFLGDGHTHKKPGPYRDTVAKGLKWIVGIQKPNGDLHDSEELGRQTAYYAHSQATIVLCEAFATTGDESLQKPAERAIAFLVKSQNPEKGGWKYMPQDVNSKGDLSVTGWALMALHSARAARLKVPEEAFELSGRFLDSVQEQDGAQYKYEPETAKPVTPSMTAEGLLCRQFLGWPKEHAPLQEGIAWLKLPENKPRYLARGANHPHVYYWYYAGQVMHNNGGDGWKAWYADVSQMIVKQQSSIGSKKNDTSGSWNPRTKDGYYGYGQYGGRLYMTAMSLLVLEIPVRHRSVYQLQ